MGASGRMEAVQAEGEVSCWEEVGGPWALMSPGGQLNELSPGHGRLRGHKHGLRAGPRSPQSSRRPEGVTVEELRALLCALQRARRFGGCVPFTASPVVPFRGLVHFTVVKFGFHGTYVISHTMKIHFLMC